MAITIDTHVLVWYIDRNLNHKLTSVAIKTIKEEEKNGTIYIPIIVLMEMLYLCEKGRINISLSEILNKLSSNSNYQIIPFDLDLFTEAQSISGLEAHDRLIVATALLTKSSLVSKDTEIKKSMKVNIIWINIILSISSP
jgi:PIN domain nuclease of toxin-antitoxin system